MATTPLSQIVLFSTFQCYGIADTVVDQSDTSVTHDIADMVSNTAIILCLPPDPKVVRGQQRPSEPCSSYRSHIARRSSFIHMRWRTNPDP